MQPGESWDRGVESRRFQNDRTAIPLCSRLQSSIARRGRAAQRSFDFLLPFFDTVSTPAPEAMTPRMAASKS